MNFGFYSCQLNEGTGSLTCQVDDPDITERSCYYQQAGSVDILRPVMR